MMIDIPRLANEMQRIEPSLDEVMRFHPLAGPEGLRLCGSVCGFASNVLAKYLRQTGVAKSAVPKIRELAEPLPFRHVVVEVEGAIIDPTYSQFMSVIGLDIALAASDPTAAALYPKRRIAVIPQGAERAFGERFAQYTLEDCAPRILRTEQTAHLPPEDALFEMLAGIWDPDQYEDFDNGGDGEAQAQRAATRMQAKCPR